MQWMARLVIWIARRRMASAVICGCPYPSQPLQTRRAWHVMFSTDATRADQMSFVTAPHCSSATDSPSLAARPNSVCAAPGPACSLGHGILGHLADIRLLTPDRRLWDKSVVVIGRTRVTGVDYCSARSICPYIITEHLFNFAHDIAPLLLEARSSL